MILDLKKGVWTFIKKMKFRCLEMKTKTENLSYPSEKSICIGNESLPVQFHKGQLLKNRSKSFDASIFEEMKMKVTVMGESGVGKSCIISRFLNNQFNAQHVKTVEDFHRGIYEINHQRLTIDILDTSGAYSFPAMRKLALESSDAFLLVYSVDKSSSLETLQLLRDEILRTRIDKASPIVVVKNKIDLSQNVGNMRDKDMEQTACYEMENEYTEASALQNINITKIFEEVLLKCKLEYALQDAVDKKQFMTEESGKQNKNRKCEIM
ncbi:hypothetical protein KUTeg_001908 [Tegillarca granosa]|uniref:Uncharacterized protein n=1 Tax=Tegillarca granosa TaxID=220873 RepID=A0ABQ9FVZ1_TEGGR|nr:hypothetical protein KUTeg_001908 [Tegillarca granosa]